MLMDGPCYQVLKGGFTENENLHKCKAMYTEAADYFYFAQKCF